MTKFYLDYHIPLLLYSVHHVSLRQRVNLSFGWLLPHFTWIESSWCGVHREVCMISSFVHRQERDLGGD